MNKIIYNNKELVALVKGTDEYLARYETITIPANSHLSYNLSFTKGQFGKLPSFTANTSSSQTLKVPYGTSYNISYTADTGYSPPASKSGTVKSTTNIETTSGNLLYYTLSVGATTNQTYSVTFTTNSSYGGTLPSNVINQTTARTFNCPYSSTAIISYTANSATAQYAYVATSQQIKTMTSNQSISNMNATVILRTYTVTIIQSDNQTITVTCDSIAHTTSFTAAYGSTYTVTIEPYTNYISGNLSSSSGTITGDITISATAATYNDDDDDDVECCCPY